MHNYVARQPIFDKHNMVIGYELLYRSGTNNNYSTCNSDRATSELINNSLLVIGFNTLTLGKKAFINFTKNLLEQDLPTCYLRILR
ncbi:hypothetical protein N752_23220 [Desulforamulus aquiferis]|nr:hypothetical protein [Desulforamulus aquiferis]RYD02693.1 hypothetical protein N752_23220 [Desulforamulus aquiferis]